MSLPSFLQQAPPARGRSTSRPARVAVVRVDRRGNAAPRWPDTVWKSLPPGAITGALGAPNMPDVAVVAAAIVRAAPRPRAAAPSARLSGGARLGRAREHRASSRRCRARAADLDELIRWQVKKTTPFPLDEAVVSHTAGGLGAGRPRVHRHRGPARRHRAVRAGVRAGRRACRRRRPVDLQRGERRARLPAAVDRRLAAGARHAHPIVSLAVLRDGHLDFLPHTRRGIGRVGRRPRAPDGDVLRRPAAGPAVRPGAAVRADRPAAAPTQLRQRAVGSARRSTSSAVDPFRAPVPAGRPRVVGPPSPTPSRPVIGILLREGWRPSHADRQPRDPARSTTSGWCAASLIVALAAAVAWAAVNAATIISLSQQSAMLSERVRTRRGCAPRRPAPRPTPSGAASTRRSSRRVARGHRGQPADSAAHVLVDRALQPVRGHAAARRAARAGAAADRHRRPADGGAHRRSHARIEDLDTFIERLEATGTFRGVLSRSDEALEDGTIESNLQGYYAATRPIRRRRRQNPRAPTPRARAPRGADDRAAGSR